MISFISNHKLWWLVLLSLLLTGCCDKGKPGEDDDIHGSRTAYIEFMEDDGTGVPADPIECDFTWPVEEVSDDYEHISQVNVTHIEIDMQVEEAWNFPSKIKLTGPGGKEDVFSAEDGDWIPESPLIIDEDEGIPSDIFLAEDCNPREYPDGTWTLTILEINMEEAESCTGITATLKILGDYQTWE